MEYAKNGSLRNNLSHIVKDDWQDKVRLLNNIIIGLCAIHELNFVHHDFHDGNILLYGLDEISISDLGFCQPVESFPPPFKKNDIYGILPFVAPEVLRSHPYTSASDIYSFSMIMWELTSGIPPFNDREHDLHLALNVCKGERPKIIDNTPQCYVDLMKKCWDENPLKRPSALEVGNITKSWFDNINRNIEKISKELKNDITEFWKANEFQRQKQITTSKIGKSHSKAYHTSRLLDFTKKF